MGDRGLDEWEIEERCLWSEGFRYTEECLELNVSCMFAKLLGCQVTGKLSLPCSS